VTGHLGLTWAAEHEDHEDRWAIVGRHPGTTHARVVVLPVQVHPGDHPAEELARVFAQLATDIGDGAGALMGADLTREGEPR
jgi:hypothetical protein